jgi:hypothetical protein
MAPWRHRGRPVVVRVARHFMGGHGLPRDGTAITLSGRVVQSGEGNDDNPRGGRSALPVALFLPPRPTMCQRSSTGKKNLRPVPSGCLQGRAVRGIASTIPALVARRAASFIELPNLLGAPSRCADFYTVWPSADRCRETGRPLFGSLLLLFPARIDCSKHLRRRHRQFG